MGYPHGLFSWTDVSVPDVEAAKTFYTGLFGWDAEDQFDPDGNYVEITYGGDGDPDTPDHGTLVEHEKRFANGSTTVLKHTKFEYDDLFRLEKREALAKTSPTAGNLGVDGWQTHPVTAA